MTTYDAEQFAVDATGAYLIRLSDTSGEPVLFTRTKIGEKLRGGSHICYPYFGPDAAGELPQHGFGREVTWQVKVSADKRQITCTHSEMTHELFVGLRACLTYRLNEQGNVLTTTLAITNHHDTPRTVMPGFHPYFAVDPRDIRLNGKAIDLAMFEPFRSFPDTESMLLETRGRRITVSSSNLTSMVVWSDSRDDYLCVEPTKTGNGFDSTRISHSVLLPGETAEYSFMIAW